MCYTLDSYDLDGTTDENIAINRAEDTVSQYEEESQVWYKFNFSLLTSLNRWNYARDIFRKKAVCQVSEFDRKKCTSLKNGFTEKSAEMYVKKGLGWIFTRRKYVIGRQKSAQGTSGQGQRAVFSSRINHLYRRLFAVLFVSRQYFFMYYFIDLFYLI